MIIYISQKIKFTLSFLILLIIGSLVYPAVSHAVVLNTNEEILPPVLLNNSTTNPTYTISVDQATITKGYTVKAFNEDLKLSLDPGTLNEATKIEIIELKEKIEQPWQLNISSKIYQFEFKNKAAYNNSHPFYIDLKYQKNSKNLKQVFFYDKNYQSWRPLPTKDYSSENFVRSLIYLPYARIAVFEFPNVLSSGQASWYSYKKGNFAASPDFPKGSRLRVFNTDNPNKFVDVEINDFGPNRDIHPTRVLDLEKSVFSKLAPLGQGSVNINVQPLYIAPVNNKTLGVPAKGLTAGLNINSTSAVVFNSLTGKIIWEKNSTTSLPIASLTKLVSAKVFLDTNPDLKRVVAYSIADEEFNYLYASKWEIAKLKVTDGETMTIEDLFYSALVGSANNAVESLVRVSGLTRDEFIARMNSEVKNMGASSSKFIEPTGLAPENVSSALDYAVISKKVLENPIIEKASKTISYSFTTINTKIKHNLKNTNPLTSSSLIKVTGSKTGYLNEARYCLMTRVEGKNNNQLIVVTLGTPTRAGSFNETKELIDYGLYKTQ